MILKWCLVLSVIILFQTAKGQSLLNKEVKINFSEGQIEQFLDSVQHQLDVVFVFSDIIGPQKVVTISKGRYSLVQVLDSLFREQSIDYIERKNAIALSPQSEEMIKANRIIVSGKVITKKEKPLPYATIYIKNRSLGTIANSEGFFKFILPKELASDTLTVSSLGYKSVSILPGDYLTKELNIVLNPVSIAIKDVVVRPEDPIYLLRESYKNRERNYSQKPVNMNAFFRESSRQDEDYVSLSEALIEIKKTGYNSGVNDLIRIIKGRNGTNISESELLQLIVEGGLFNGIRLDVAKYGSSFYSENAVEVCELSFVDKIFFQDKLTYVIYFNTKPIRDYPGYKGKLYINAETLALARAEFKLNEYGLKYSRSYLVKKSPLGYKVRPSYAEYEVEYRFYDGVWNLHYARSELGLKVKKARGRENKGYSCKFITTSEFVITGVSDTLKKKIPFREISKSNDILVEQIKNTGSNFWHNDNIIIPEEPLIQTISKLQVEGEIPNASNIPIENREEEILE